MNVIPVLNKTMGLSECRDKWVLDEKNGCYMLEDVLYTQVPTIEHFCSQAFDE